ncbi:hypothetical protein [Erwinia rhapontici]|uniref:hypothetical protein n=1 Tax=Erwinia rhapontici TaxID=55212 RepID=UPI003D365B0B
MTTEITSHQAEEMAIQAELVCGMLELYPNESSSMQVLAVAGLIINSLEMLQRI